MYKIVLFTEKAYIIKIIKYYQPKLAAAKLKKGPQ